MGTPRRQRWFTRDRAGYVVAALLVAAAVLGHFERRIIPADDIPLSTLPTQVGRWTAVEEKVTVEPDGSFTMLERKYESDGGPSVYLTAQATYTRLGSLRDWSLAAMGYGFTPMHETAWRSADGSVTARIQRLEDGRESRVALSWYTSAQSQSDSYRRAQIMGWRDRLLGRYSPWAGLYLFVANSDEYDAEEALTELADGAASELRVILAGPAAVDRELTDLPEGL